VALFNAVLLLVSIGAIVYEAIQRMYHPAPLPGKIIAAVAAVGIVINAVTALLFFREKSRDLNVRSAYLHLMSDALVSAVIVAGGVLISFTGLYRIDAMLSILVAGVILYTS
jgi:cobalt-zinc-cadmium efflux system protein